MRCGNCRKSIANMKYASVRKWCSDECRGAGRRERARSRFVEWRRATLPRRTPDLELTLLELSPIGAWYYRLSCPGLGNGSKRYFPTGKGWRLRLFVPPAVPWAGFYDVVFYDEHGEIVAEASGVPVVAQKRAPIGSGDHRRELNAQPRPPRRQGARRRAAPSSAQASRATETPRPQSTTETAQATIQHRECTFCNDLHICPTSASTSKTPMDGTHLRAEAAGGPSPDPAEPPEVPHRAPTKSGNRSKWWPHRRADLRVSVRRRATEERDGHRTAPPDQRPAQDHEEAERDPSDQAARAPPERPDG